MLFYVSFETPGFLVAIHRGGCRHCRNGTVQSTADARHLSWSRVFGSHAEALRHARNTYGFFRAAVNCSDCHPEGSGQA
ncbi:hypothetical protein [Taklimakanibacter lacteus]|uniref:hypothetical protein n=1 Tax=Taklimakanibacter lacteus TaxID=2268456 RepID=UPI000E65F963